MTNEMWFDHRKLQALEAAYHRALEAGTDTFVFDGHELLVGYAKYLIEYLETKLTGGSNG